MLLATKVSGPSTFVSLPLTCCLRKQPTMSKSKFLLAGTSRVHPEFPFWVRTQTSCITKRIRFAYPQPSFARRAIPASPGRDEGRRPPAKVRQAAATAAVILARKDQQCCAAKRSIYDPRGFIGGFDRLRKVCVHGDAEQRSIVDRPKRTPNPHGIGVKNDRAPPPNSSADAQPKFSAVLASFGLAALRLDSSGHHWPSPCRTIHIQTAVPDANLLGSHGSIKISLHHYFRVVVTRRLLTGKSLGLR